MQGVHIRVVPHAPAACGAASDNHHIAATPPHRGGRSGWIQVLQYGQGEWQLPLSELRVASPDETWCGVDSWHDPAGGDYLVKTVDGVPFVNPEPGGCGFGAVGSVLIYWVPAP